MGKKPKGFHQPFAALAERTKELVPAPKPKPPAPPAPAPVPPLDEERLFADEMAGVAPLDPDPRGRLNAPAPTPRPPVSRRVREEAEAYAQLAELVGGEGAFDISDSDEYIEGLAPGVDRRLLKKLRRGDFALQGHLDLHGLTAEEARGEVERFLDGACAAGKRCLLIIHGRGLNSKEGVPILKERLKVWLSRGRLSRAVLAFSTARPADGGAGAIYVLLRR
ncbi:MAG TPA: Smr/MutS family protein [Polyangia bacterium]|jgi:DNA-nicking Smr family endonuclease